MSRVRHKQLPDYDSEPTFTNRYLKDITKGEDAKMGMATSVLKNKPHGVTVAELEDDAEFNLVDHPAHYNTHPSGVECIDIIEHWSYNIGAAMKYLWRAGLKPGADHVEDLRKAIRCIEREINRLDPDVEFK